MVAVTAKIEREQRRVLAWMLDADAPGAVALAAERHDVAADVDQRVLDLVLAQNGGGAVEGAVGTADETEVRLRFVEFHHGRELADAADVPPYFIFSDVTLMEMAMSGNRAYLDKFYNDLASHHFAAIAGAGFRVDERIEVGIE